MGGLWQGFQPPDHHQEEGLKYMFRVKAVNTEGESENLDSDNTVHTKNPYNPLGPPSKPRCSFTMFLINMLFETISP